MCLVLRAVRDLPDRLTGLARRGGHLLRVLADHVQRLPQRFKGGVHIHFQRFQVPAGGHAHAFGQLALGHGRHDMADIAEEGLLRLDALVDVVLQCLQIAGGLRRHTLSELALGNASHHPRDVLEHLLLGFDALVDSQLERVEVAAGLHGDPPFEVALCHAVHHIDDVLERGVQGALHRDDLLQQRQFLVALGAFPGGEIAFADATGHLRHQGGFHGFAFEDDGHEHQHAGLKHHVGCMDQDQPWIHLAAEHIKLTCAGGLQDAETHMVHGDQASGHHHGTPVAVIEQEGQQGEDAEVHLGHALVLLNHQGRRDHECTGDGRARDQRARCGAVDHPRHYKGGQADGQRDVPGVRHRTNAQAEQGQESQRGQHQAVGLGSLGLQHGFGVGRGSRSRCSWLEGAANHLESQWIRQKPPHQIAGFLQAFNNRNGASQMKRGPLGTLLK